jgi:predicted HTH transcriptional regulator
MDGQCQPIEKIAAVGMVSSGQKRENNMPYTKEKIGYQNINTSRNAAEFNKDGKITLRDQVMAFFETEFCATAEETANALGRPEISVQPRISELKNKGLIRASGKTKQGRWGTQITIWELIKNVSQ